MINGLAAMEFIKLPVSQIYKLVLLLLFFLRLAFTKDFVFVLALLLIFQIAPLAGLIKTGNFEAYISDVIIATKWFNVPLSFFYFKNLFQSSHFYRMRTMLKKVISRSFWFILINMGLGLLGFGMAFYNHGYPNAVGTRGFIYAGNELTILVLALGFLIACYYIARSDIKRYLMMLACFVLIAFLITSKTVIGGVIIVFLIPVLASIRFSFNRKWMDWIVASFVFGIPLMILAFYVGITRSGILEKLAFSMRRNDYDPLTVLLSNRNNFIRQGWEVYDQDYSIWGKIFGYGQQYHLELSGHLAEVDFFSLLFSAGYLGLFSLFFVIFYWLVNATYLKSVRGYIHARSSLIFLLFIVVAANLSGHVFGSGIAGFFIGLSLAIMYYKEPITSE